MRIERHFCIVDQYEVVDITNGGVEVLEAPSRGGVWHIERCPPTSHVKCSTLRKTTNRSCIARIITKLIAIGVPTPIYFSLSF